MANTVSFMVVDDHPIFRQGLVALLRSEENYQVCAEAGSVHEALSLLESQKPDLALVDISLGGKSGLDLVKSIKAQRPETLSLVISIHDEEIYAERALKAGAKGYVMKQEAAQVMLEAIKTILAGKIYVSESIRFKLLETMFQPKEGKASSSLGSLSDRELEVLTHIGQGFGLSEIAERLNVSVKTVNVYQEHIKRKLSLDTAGELRKFAVSWVSSVDR